jgi:hypothetical protein
MSVNQERVEEAASSIADQLCLLYPNGMPGDDTVIKKHFNDLLDNLPKSEGEKSSFYQDLLMRAIPIAVQQWKVNRKNQEPAKTGGTSSFSLLDQLNAGFALPVTLEEIQEASSAQERLTVFQKIEFVEDLLPDWREIRLLVRAGLDNDTDAVALHYLALHRKWFDQARTSTDYVALEYDLCQNLVDSITGRIASLGTCSSENSLLFALIQNWHDMFLDLMQRGQYSEDKDMEVNMMLLLRNISIGGDILPAQIMGFIDPQARWFRSWADHVTPPHLVSLLEQTGLVPDLVARCQMPVHSTNDHAATLDHVLRLQSVAVLTSIICTTRVAFFPWHLFSSSPSPPLSTADLLKDPKSSSTSVPPAGSTAPTGPNTPSNEQVDSMLTIFLDTMLHEAKPEWTLICSTGMETILWGCQTAGVELTPRLAMIKCRLTGIMDDPAKQAAAEVLEEVLVKLQ